MKTLFGRLLVRSGVYGKRFQNNPLFGEYSTNCVRSIANHKQKPQGVIDIADLNATAAEQRTISDDNLKELIDIFSRYRFN